MGAVRIGERTTNAPAPRTRRSWRSRLLATAVGLCAGLLLAEGLLRVAGISYPSFYTTDPYLGARLRAGASGVWTAEGRGVVEINSEGWRDVEHSKEKPPGTLRIAVLGDSYAEALQVDVDETFWWQLQENLRQRPGLGYEDVEVLNFGVSGYGTAQELLAYRHYARDYDPDIVLLAFLTGNDIRNNSRALEGDPMRPYFVMNHGALTLDDSFRRSTAYQQRQGALYRFIHAVVRNSRLAQVLNQVVRARGSDGPAAQEQGLSAQIYAPPRDDVWVSAWQVTEELIAQLAREVADDGAKLVVMLVSNGIQVDARTTARAEYASFLGVDELEYPNRRIAGFCGTHDIPVIDLVPEFARHAEATGTQLHGFGDAIGRGHWNAAGHARAATLLTEWLTASRLAVAEGRQE